MIVLTSYHRTTVFVICIARGLSTIVIELLDQKNQCLMNVHQLPQVQQHRQLHL